MSKELADRQFEYLLNAMENAAQSASPALQGYGEKRKAVLDYVAALRSEPVQRESPELRIAGSRSNSGTQSSDHPTEQDADTKHLRKFFDKHALGLLVAPSCLKCGQSKPFTIKHMELPNIGLCASCSEQDADELLREVLDWGLPDDLKQRIDAHLSRKEQA